MDRRRFQNLEKARPERRHAEAPAEEAEAAVRIEAVETDEGVSEHVQTGLARERFEEPPIALATVAPDEPLFHRCHVCGADNQRVDVTCQHCTADLRTLAQEAFDAKLTEKEHEAQRQEQVREWHREQERSGALLPETAQVELGKAIAEMVAEEQGEGRQPVAWRLLCKLPGPWRWVAVAGVALGYFALYRASERSSGWAWVWLMTGFLSLLLFTPPRFWTQTVNRNRWF